MTELPSLRETLDAHGLLAKKSFGQHFLLDLNVTRKIVRLGGPFEGRNVIEVGPGPGGLTRAILESDAGKIILIEKDPRFIPLLSELDDGSGRLTIVEGDALKVREADLSEGPTHLVSNLPYNVGTQLLLNWLLPKSWPPFWDSLTLMFQKEVGLRIVARENDDHYGRLGVLAGWRTEARMVFDVPPQAFTPPPKVTSSIVHLTPRQAPLPCDVKKLETVTQAAFGQRRKMLRQSLKALGGEALLSKAGIDPVRRAETLSVEEFVTLANAL